MCGIAGIIYRRPQDYQNLGSDLLKLIRPLQSRGPDSCGVGLFGNAVKLPLIKIIFLAEEDIEEEAFKQWLAQQANLINFESIDNSYRVILKSDQEIEALKDSIAERFPQINWLSIGRQLEVYKKVSSCRDLFDKYKLNNFAGSHAIAHTRMATESIVNTFHCHPFVSGQDLCVVHNGQISNYYKLRYSLEKQGFKFATDNDSEAIAHYLRSQLLQGKSLENALKMVLKDLDGTYTFLAATPDKVALVRDKFAAKPAVIYESDTKIAITSEYRCLMELPDFDDQATIREPDAGEVNIWSVSSHFPQTLKPSVSV